MKHTYKDTETDCIYLTIAMSALVALMVAISGCSIKAEIGYYGKTGKDDRQYTVEDNLKAVRSQKY